MKMNTPQFALGKYAVKRAKKPAPPPEKPVDPSSNPSRELNKLQEVVKESESVLIHAKSMFPFMLFPDSITIDRHKLTIFYRKFLGTGQTVSVPIDNIKNIQADVSPLFGAVTITSDHFVNNTQTITHLPKKEAQKIQQLVQGAIVAIQEGIDTTEIKAKELVELLCKLGNAEASGASGR